MKKPEFIQSYLTLKEDLYSVVQPYNNENSKIVIFNDDLSKQLNLDKTFWYSEEGEKILSGSDNRFGPLFSQAYSGHQYGYFTTLGDGRAVLIGEYENDNKIFDFQLKGAGETPYSRRGDGKATLYSMLREYIISEAMHHLKIPTTRSLAVLDTNRDIQRLKIEKGGILCRVASSHIRVGTIEFAAANTNINTLRNLVDYAINRHYNHLNHNEDKYRLFLQEVIKMQAKLISKWQSVGFVHGVMNTDNMTISGETIDYGPCAFLDAFVPDKSFSSIDENNRYAYNKQPYIGSWNLMKLAEALLPLLNENVSKAVAIANNELSQFETFYKDSYYSLFGKKLGFITPSDDDKTIIDEFLLILKKYKGDFTNSFMNLTLDQYDNIPFSKTNDFTIWFQKWTRQLGYRKMDPKKRIQLMKQSNPIIIPRNQIVEKALRNASEQNDYSLFNELLFKLKTPFDYNMTVEREFLLPLDTEEEFVTYCGT